MTPAEFKSYAEMAGWLVIGLYLFARLVRGDREISVRIGGSKRRVKLRELAERVEECESKLYTAEEAARARVPAAAHDWVERTNKEVAEKLQALDERHDHLATAVSGARARAEEALVPAQYAENMLDRVMPLIAWLAWRAGVKLEATFCNGNPGGTDHRRQAVGLARSFKDVADEDLTPPTIEINDNHCPFPVEVNATGKEFLRVGPEEANARTYGELVADVRGLRTEYDRTDKDLTVARDDLARLKQALLLVAMPGREKQHYGISMTGLRDLIEMLTAALFTDELRREPQEFSRLFRNAIRLAARTAGESDAPHIAEDEKPKPLTDIEWAEALGMAATHLGHVGGLRRYDAVGVETGWGLAYLSLVRPREIWFARSEPSGPRSVIEFKQTVHGHYVSWEDSQGVIHLRKIVCVGDEADLINGRLVPLESGMEVEGLADTDNKAGADERDFQLRCAPPTSRVSVCAGCQNVERCVDTTDGELCAACTTSQIEKENHAPAYTESEWEELLEQIAERLGDGAPITACTRLMVATTEHGRAWLKLKTPNRLLFEDAARVVTELNAWDDAAGSWAKYHDLRGAQFVGSIQSIGEDTMCDHCGKVEVEQQGVLCPACVEYEKKEEETARAKTGDEQWRESLRKIAKRLGDAKLTMDSRILLKTRQHGPAYLLPDSADVIFFEYGHYDVDEIIAWGDPAGSLVRYRDTAGTGYFAVAVSMSEGPEAVGRAFREHREAKPEAPPVIATATVQVTFYDALKQATKPPAAVLAFWETVMSTAALMSLFDKNTEETSYTFGATNVEHPEIGDPVISETGICVGKVADWNDDREGNAWTTVEAATGGMYVLPVLRVIKPEDREDYR